MTSDPRGEIAKQLGDDEFTDADNAVRDHEQDCQTCSNRSMVADLRCAEGHQLALARLAAYHRALRRRADKSGPGPARGGGR